MSSGTKSGIGPGISGVPGDSIISGVGGGSILTLASASAAGVPGNGLSFDIAISNDGSKVLFTSVASNLVDGDTNGVSDIFLKEMNTGAITRISEDTSVAGYLNPFGVVTFSNDGSKIAFVSGDDSLAAGGDNGLTDIFVQELATGITTRISNALSGEEGNLHSHTPVFSPDGNKIAFFSLASNLVAGDTNGREDIFIKDLLTGEVSRIALDVTGTINGYVNSLAFSPDGTKLVFSSEADNLVAGDTNGASDIFVKDFDTDAITLVSTDSTGTLANGHNFEPVFSPDSTSIAFSSWGDNLVGGDTNSVPDIFIKNLNTGLTTRVSTDSAGQQVAGYSVSFVFSPDGTSGAFVSNAEYIAGTAGAGTSIYVKNLITEQVTQIPGGFPTGAINGGSSAPTYSADGSALAFHEYAQYDVNGAPVENFGVFVHTFGQVSNGEVLTGGQGTDTASYEASLAAVTVDLRDADGSSNNGDAVNDTYVSIENFSLTKFGDFFFGANKAGTKNWAFGLEGQDTFTSGGKGTTNTFDGGDGADVFIGSAGKTVASGGNGDDFFLGGAGAEAFYGGAGADTMNGGKGNDQLAGGVGADTFVFNFQDNGKDAITDFEIGIDALRFEGLFADDLTLRISHDEVRITIEPSGATITIHGVTDMVALQGDFLFV